jgi:hypothetical protein
MLHNDNAPSHTSFPAGKFYRNRHDCSPHPPRCSLFPLPKIKLKGRHFDTFEVTEAESQAVSNTLTVNDFQDEFKKWQKGWERCVRAEGDSSRAMVPVGPKLVSEQMAVTVSEIMDSSSCRHYSSYDQ